MIRIVKGGVKSTLCNNIVTVFKRLIGISITLFLLLSILALNNSNFQCPYPTFFLNVILYVPLYLHLYQYRIYDDDTYLLSTWYMQSTLLICSHYHPYNQTHDTNHLLSTKRLITLLKFTQLLDGRARIWNKSTWLQKPFSKSLSAPCQVQSRLCHHARLWINFPDCNRQVGSSLETYLSLGGDLK